MKTKPTIFILIFFFGFFGLAKMASADTHYVCNNISTCNADGGSGWSGTPGALSGCGSKTNPCDTLARGYAAMSAGDTLIIGSGTYTGSSNRTTASQVAPSGTYNGTTGSFSTVRAEIDWKVTIDGQNTNNMFQVQYGSHNALWFQGLVWRRDTQGVQFTGVSGTLYNYWAFKNCGFEMIYNGSATQGTVYPAYTNHLLMEDCAVWGDGRYGIGSFMCNNILLRRVVVRLDAPDAWIPDACSGTGCPIASVVTYGIVNSEYQNVIALDTNDASFTNFSMDFGFFPIRGQGYTNTNNYFRGCIGLNGKWSRTDDVNLGWTGAAVGQGGGSNAQHISSIYWDLATSNLGAFYNNGYDLLFDHLTLGAVNGDGANSYTVASQGATNNTWTHITGTALSGSSISYNNFHGNGSNGTAGTNSTTVDPIWSASNTNGGLKYLPRIEAGSNLAGTGSGGTDRGATVMYKIGVDGTFYGQTGYNTVTTNPLWPYPNEAIIKSLMASYVSTYQPATNNKTRVIPSATRGFAGGTSKDGSPQTLTKYIWEYLGNQIPADIYGGSGDTTAPSAPSGLSVN